MIGGDDVVGRGDESLTSVWSIWLIRGNREVGKLKAPITASKRRDVVKVESSSVFLVIKVHCFWHKEESVSYP